MSFVRTFISAVLGGACIGFGGIAYLSLDSKLLGALFFTVGLFCVCCFQLNLFTGKVCYVFQRDKGYALNIPVIWLGNLAGTGIVAALVQMTRIAVISEKAVVLCRAKMDDSLLSLFVLGILCNIFIYVGVEGFNQNPHETGKYLSLFFGVMVFILCGFEHCVADMFYFSVAKMWSGEAVLRLLVITLGNSLGGILFPETRKFISK